MNDFPKYEQNRRTAERGVTLVKQVIEDEFRWIFRPTPLEHDFGIDAYIDIITENNQVTGRYLGVQIKTGASYFLTKKANGWLFRGDLKHINYYMNLNHTVLIFLVDIDSKDIYWVEFDLDKISETKSGWSIVVPENQKVNKEVKHIFKKMAGSELDYLSQLKYQWAINEEFMKDEVAIVAIEIHREEIENLDIEGLVTLQKRLTANEDMVKKCKGKLTFVIIGYDEDSRELYEIPEVRQWAKLALHEFKYWGYFLNMDGDISKYYGLGVLFSCCVDYKIAEKDIMMNSYMEMDDEQTNDFVGFLFHWLNILSDEFGIPETINREQSSKITKIIYGEDMIG